MMYRLRLMIAILIGVAALEVCARVDDWVTYGAPVLGIYDIDTIYRYDRLGKRGKPNARYKKWHLNSLGYRGPEPLPGPRIICVGASETFGLYEPEGGEYPRQLEREFNAHSALRPVSVINVAIPGETISTVEQRIPEIVETLHPQIAVIYPSVATYIWLPWVKQSTPHDIRLQDHLPRFEWRIGENIRTLLKEVTPGSVQRYWLRREIDRSSSSFPQLDRVPEENVETFRHDLTGLVRALRSRGVEPMVVTHATAFGPHLALADQDYLVHWKKFYPMLSDEGFIDMEQRMNQAIRDVAREQHLNLVDAAVEIPPGRTYFADAIHFTPTGARFIGALLAERLLSLTQPDTRAPELLTATPRRVTGDWLMTAQPAEASLGAQPRSIALQNRVRRCQGESSTCEAQ